MTASGDRAACSWPCGGALAPLGPLEVQPEQAVQHVDELDVPGQRVRLGRVSGRGGRLRPAHVRGGGRELRQWAGRRTTDLPSELPHEVVHRDDLVVLA